MQYYLSDICTLMLPVCFQFPALTCNYLYLHLFKQNLQGKEIKFSPRCVLSAPYSGNQHILTVRGPFQTLHCMNVMGIFLLISCLNKHLKHFSIKVTKAIIDSRDWTFEHFHYTANSLKSYCVQTGGHSHWKNNCIRQLCRLVLSYYGLYLHFLFGSIL